MSLSRFLRRLFGGGSEPTARRPRTKARERSPGGSAILRHRERAPKFEIALPGGEDSEAIQRHVEAHVGPVQSVYHEVISNLVHLDVLIVAPRPERPYWTLVTSGMSDRPMTVPRGAEALRHAELMLCLPPSWQLSNDALKDKRNAWPLTWLKFLARFPHEHETWLADGHTLPNGDPAESLHEGVAFTGWLLTLPRRFGAKFLTVHVSPNKIVNIYAIYPIHSAEMALKLEQGTERVNELFDEAGVTELIDPERPSVA